MIIEIIKIVVIRKKDETLRIFTKMDANQIWYIPQ